MSEMTYRRLGGSGLAVSVVGLGCNNFGMRIDQDATQAVVDAAIEEGVTLFDTSDSYGESEVMLAKALGVEARPGRDRHQVRQRPARAPTAPTGVPGAAVATSARRSSARCERLDTDWIDLYQIHYPDPHTPIEETLGALSDLVHEGLVRYIGHSNFAGWQIADAAWTAETGGLEHFVSAQNHYNLVERQAETEVVPACERFGLGLLPYFPLASGLLTGKYHRGDAAPEGGRIAAWGMNHLLSDANFDVVEAIEDYAAQRGLSLLEVAIGGLAARPAVASVIAGATSAAQMKANALAGEWTPSADDLAALDALLA